MIHNEMPSNGVTPNSIMHLFVCPSAILACHSYIVEACPPRTPGKLTWSAMSLTARGLERDPDDRKLGLEEGKLPSLQRCGRQFKWQNCFQGGMNMPKQVAVNVDVQCCSVYGQHDRYPCSCEQHISHMCMPQGAPVINANDLDIEARAHISHELSVPGHNSECCRESVQNTQ